MPKRKPNNHPKPARKRITTKAVQGSQDKPFNPPSITPEPEIEESPFGEHDGLTELQRRFVHHFMGAAAGVAARAAEMAGYRAENRNSLYVTAHHVLHKPAVQRAIERIRGQQFGSADDVRASLGFIAGANAMEFLEAGPDGKLHVSLEKLAENGATGLIEKVEEERIESGGTVTTVKIKITPYSKLEALKVLAKMNGQLKDQMELSGSVETSSPMEALMNNPAAAAAAKAMAEALQKPE